MKFGKRNIKDGSKFNHLFPAAKNEKINKGNNGVEKNVNEIIPQVVKNYNWQAKDIANHLYDPDLHKFCKNIWQFCFDYIQYEFDKPGREQLRTPQRVWADRISGVDCDCFSIFISSILTQKNIPHCIRITKYDNKIQWQHIYVVVPKSDKPFNPYEPSTYWIIDAVIHEFNVEKEFTDQKTYYMSGQLGTVTEVLNGFPSRRMRKRSSKVISRVLSGLGEASETELDKIKNHIAETRVWIENNPTAYAAQGGDQATMLKMIDYALDNWDKGEDIRNKALEILAQNEARYNAEVLKIDDADLDDIIDDDDYDFDGLGNFGATKVQRKAKRTEKKAAKKAAKVEKKAAKVEKKAAKQEKKAEKKEIKSTSKVERKVERKEEKAERKEERQEAQGFFRKVGVAAKQGGQAVFVKYNPAIIAGRQGLLMVIKLNLFRLASRLAPAYGTEAQAKAKGQNYAASKKMLDKVLQIFDEKLQGSSAEFKEAVLIGALKPGQDLQGIIETFGVLGAIDPVTLSAIMSAVPIVVSVVNAINEVEYDYGIEGWTIEDDIYEAEIIADQLEGLAATGAKKVTAKIITDWLKKVLSNIKENREAKKSMSKEDYKKEKSVKKLAKKANKANKEDGLFKKVIKKIVTGQDTDDQDASDDDADNEEILQEKEAKINIDPTQETWWSRNKKKVIWIGGGVLTLAVLTGAIGLTRKNAKAKAVKAPDNHENINGLKSHKHKKVINANI